MKKGFSILPLTCFLLMLTGTSVVLARFYLARRAAIHHAEIMELKLHQEHKMKQMGGRVVVRGARH
ncbi:MAG: hypothetical protein J0L93_01655 [Deltaproteobacteria bacterium]|nr:hypothetical protein [Deltaproteobacteria bacterium]